METEKKPVSVDVIIPVYHPDEKLNTLLQRLCEQTVCPNHIILLHTIEQENETLKLNDDMDGRISVYPIKKEEFDHGATRAYGVSLSSADVFMCMTQDALPENNLLIEKLLEALESDGKVAAAYARQLPTKHASDMECYTRSFNYPKVSRTQSKDSVKEYGIKAFFCSNVCAAYKAEIYHELGGFVKKTIFNEDMIYAFDLIYSDYKIIYAADAKVIHSHNYSYMQQLHRNFDLGVSHKEYDFLFGRVKSESEGIQLVKRMLHYATERKKYYLIPDIILSNGFKYIGYQLGKHYRMLPKSVIRSLSMNKGYFKD